MPWVYDAQTDYAPHLRPLAEAGVSTVVAPAVWNWNEVFPDYHRSFININGLAATGRKFRSLGILNTGWTDSAQTLYRQSLPGLALGAAAGWQSVAVDTNTFFADYAAQMYPAAVAADVAGALEELSTVEEMFESILQDSTLLGFWRDPLDPPRLARLEKNRDPLRKARLMAESALEHLMRARRTAPEDPTLNSLIVAARLFDYLGMKSLYAVEWSGYFRELQKNPDAKLVTLYINNQMNAQDHGMLADLADAVSGLREDYRQAWLEESTPYRLGTALARWDAETQHWLSTWRNVNQLLRTRRKDEPFPSNRRAPAWALKPPRSVLAPFCGADGAANAWRLLRLLRQGVGIGAAGHVLAERGRAHRRNCIAVVECRAARRTDGHALEIGADVVIGHGLALGLVEVRRPGLNRPVNALQVADAGLLAGHRAGLHEVGHGYGGQHSYDGHHDHDFHQGETPAPICICFHTLTDSTPANENGCARMSASSGLGAAAAWPRRHGPANRELKPGKEFPKLS